MAAVPPEQQKTDPADIRPCHMMDGKGPVPEVQPDAPAQQVGGLWPTEAQAAIAMAERDHTAFLRCDGGGEDIRWSRLPEIAEMPGLEAEQPSAGKQ